MEATFGWLLAIIGTSWGAFSTCLNVVKFLNELRNQVFLGKIGSNEITPTHRRRIYLDWIGSCFIYVGMGLAYSVVLFVIPFFLDSDQKWTVGIVSWIFAIAVFSYTMGAFAYSMIFERRELKDVVDSAK